MQSRELAQKVIRKTFIPAETPENEKEKLARELYDVHSRIFSGVSLEQFISHVIEPSAEHTAIQVYCDEAGNLVGYCAFHRFVRKIHGRRSIVLRAEAGLLPQYRGKAVAHWFGMLGALREKILHPFQRIFYLGTLVHPSSYRFFCKYFPTVFPRLHQNMPFAGSDLAIEIAESFDDPAVDPHNPLVRQVGWVTIDTLEHPDLVSEEGMADVRYFETLNPDYRLGHGLVVLVPVTIGNVGSAILKRISEILSGWIRKRPYRL